MIALPFVVGAVHVTFTLDVPAWAFGAAGADGTPYGVTDDDGVDVGPVPLALWALTLNL